MDDYFAHRTNVAILSSAVYATALAQAHEACFLTEPEYKNKQPGLSIELAAAGVTDQALVRLLIAVQQAKEDGGPTQ